jgi:hypothetical protein
MLNKSSEQAMKEATEPVNVSLSLLMGIIG